MISSLLESNSQKKIADIFLYIKQSNEEFTSYIIEKICKLLKSHILIVHMKNEEKYISEFQPLQFSSEIEEEEPESLNLNKIFGEGNFSIPNKIVELRVYLRNDNELEVLLKYEFFEKFLELFQKYYYFMNNYLFLDTITINTNEENKFGLKYLLKER